MPSLLALSVRLAEIPEPGKAMRPIGRTESIWSLRRNGAALAWRVPSGLKAVFGTFRAAAVKKHHVGMPLMGLVEPFPDGAMVIEVETARKGDLGSGRQQDLG